MIHRERGALDDALKDIREAARLQEVEAAKGEVGRVMNFVLTLSRQGAILGDDNGVSLGRPTEALAVSSAPSVCLTTSSTRPQASPTALAGSRWREWGWRVF